MVRRGRFRRWRARIPRQEHADPSEDGSDLSRSSSATSPRLSIIWGHGMRLRRVWARLMKVPDRSEERSDASEEGSGPSEEGSDPV